MPVFLSLEVCACRQQQRLFDRNALRTWRRNVVNLTHRGPICCAYRVLRANAERGTGKAAAAEGLMPGAMPASACRK